MVRFDAYSATTTALKPPDVVPWLFGPGDTMREGRGFHQFAERLAVSDQSGTEVGAVLWGGRQGDRIMVEIKGERTPHVVERLREAAEHRCTRVDSCVDFERPGAFDELLEEVLATKARHGLYGEKHGDWEFPELGRTQDLGAPSSAIRGRLYEKGKQPEYRHLGRHDLVRLELQIRPAKDAKTSYSKLSALEVWGASKWTRELSANVLAVHLDPQPPGTIRRDSSYERGMRWLCGQGGHLLMQCAAAHGGDWSLVGPDLRERIKELKGMS